LHRVLHSGTTVAPAGNLNSRAHHHTAEMPVVPPEKLIQLQQAADNVRNICIMAHVVSARRAFRYNIR
jgi:hypothetical protein